MVKRKLYIVLVLAAVSALLLWSVAAGEELPGTKKLPPKSLSKVAGSPQYQILNINNITTWTRYDGVSNFSPSNDDGVYYPVGTGNVVYEDGFQFGGKIFTNAALTTPPPVQPIRVGGNGYLGNLLNATRGGYVTGFGATAVAEGVNDADNRCYRIRRDYYFMSDAELTYDAQTTNEITSAAVTQTMKDNIKQQYDTDWKNWPVAHGAPYIERNGIPGYQAPPPFSDTFTPDNLISGNYDEPGVAGADPNSPADQVIFHIFNDLDASQSVRFTGSQPQGYEIQKTIWGYKRTDAMGNIYFTRHRLINKGGVDIGGGVRGSFWVDSMYVCQWSDIDLGNAGDDLAGSDSTLNMMFVYNGNAVDNTFAKFGLPPPASGYAFLAGPQVVSPGDSAVFDFKRIKGKKNLGMSSCVYFSAGSPYSDPPGTAANYNTGCFQWYAMLQGYAPAGQFGSAYSKYQVPPGVDPNTRYMLSGDPVTQTGFVDGKGTNYSFAPGDRRILLNSGPFKFAPGDTNETYIGFVVGLGADRLSSVSVMKFNYRFVANTFNALFQVPKPPPTPKVSIAELDEKIVLDWAADPVAVNNIENKFQEPGHYRFEGYNVYQLPSANSQLSDGKRLATYDTQNDPAVVTDLAPVSGVIVAIPVQFGTNSGISRQFIFDKDKIKDLGKIYNGKEYYLAVTAYSVATVAGFLPAALESPPIIYTVVPKSGPFGAQYGGAYGDTLAVTKTGASDGKVYPIVLNPSALTGNSYKVGFDSLGWYLTNTTTGVKKLTAQSNQSGDGNYLTIDGIQVKVTGPPNVGMIAWSIPNGARQFSPVGGFTGLGLESFGSGGDPVLYDQSAGTIGMGGHFAFGSIGTTLTIADYKNTLLKLAAVNKTTLWDPLVKPADANFSRAYRYLRAATGTPGQPSFVPWIINKVSGYPYQDFNWGVPFSAWNTETTPSTRLAVGHFENNVPGGFVDGRYWPDLTTGDNSVARELAFIFSAPYSETADPTFTTWNNSAKWPLMWVMACARRNDADWAAGNEMLFTAAHVNAPSVSFTFTAPTMVANGDLAKASMDKITVFPNPYYCINSSETSRFVKYVQFTNMPNQATIRIFNLAGQLVRTLQKNDASTFFKWDLANAVSYPVASGMYIAYIEVPNVGTKVIKMAVIQEQELLDYY
jgi:hypothetical protein